MKGVFTSVSRGLLFIVLGVIFFLINFGILSWGFWVSVIDLWPLILILVGISLFFKKRLPFSFVILVFLIALAGFSLIFGVRSAPWDSLRYKLPHYIESGIPNSDNSMSTDAALPSGVTKAELKIDLNDALIDLGPLDPETSQNQLCRGTYTWNNIMGDQPEFGTQQEGNSMGVYLSSNMHDGKKNNLNIKNILALDLSSKVKYTLNINVGAVDGDFDFSQLEVEKLLLKTGASKFDLEFGDNGLTTEGKIDSGVSEITLVIPENAGLHVYFDGVACETNFMGSGLLLDNKEWSSPGYDQAKTKINLDISCAAGSVHLIRSGSQDIQGANLET
ncbi:MAG TPA: DUF5668 domain-containing protein [Desulfitobacteriaceae bacterium]|nr:DUF5668 domain-containing protein [Desulfitobacteriaceae bacterium]